MRPATRRPSPLLLALVAVGLAVSGCSSGGEDSPNAASGVADDAAAGPREGAVDGSELARAQRAATDELETSFDSAANMLSSSRPANDVTGRKLIAKGDVSLESDDVEATVFEVEKLCAHYLGEITQRETTTDDDGDVSTAQLLLRIPVKDFDHAFSDLEKVADLQSSNTGKEDVTTKVIDTQVRIRAQRRSLARVEQLLDRAQSISDIIRIESQLSRRQADLESLERRLSYLDDQTSMSTVSVNISLPPEEKQKKKDEPEEAGFLHGLSDGWHALKSFGTDVATLTGQLLPFAGVALVVGGPLWLVVRRFRGRDGAPMPTAPADA